MKFILMMNSARDGYETYLNWPKDVLDANFAFMGRFTQKLSAAGELVALHGLAAPTAAKRVRAGKDGKPVTDGVFPESKEYLAGYWIVDVDTAERAYQLAAEICQAPGIGDKPMEVEVREVLNSHRDLK